MKTQKENNDKIRTQIETTTGVTHKKHKCALCLFSTNIITSLKRHLTTHSTEKPFKCPECPYKANRKDAVLQHVKFVHLLRLPSSRPFPCSHPGCSYAAKEKANLTKHSKIHSGEKHFVCSYPNCNYSTNQKVHLTAHVRIHTGEKPFLCKFESCSYATTQRSHLVIHTRIHTKEKPYKCPEPNCKYSSAEKSSVKKHQLTHEPKEGKERPSFSCPTELCEYSTKWKSALSFHMKTHTLEKLFACSFESCEFRCQTKQTLDNHLETHSEYRRYKCELCPYRGKTRDYVRKHLKNIHSDPNFRPFKCPESQCLYATKNQQKLNKHFLIHSKVKKYVCSFPGCEYRAIRKRYVNNHEYNIHSDEKREKCRICDFQCKLKSSLTRHIRTHTKEEPYKCKEETCDYRAKTSGTLRKHETKNHP